MPFNGSGGTSQPANSLYPATANTLIESAKANTSIADLYMMLSGVVCKDGQTTTTARIPFAAGISNGSQTLTAVADGTSTTHAATVGQIQSSAPTTLGTVAGTANAITADATPAITAYASGQKFTLVPASTNTSTTTIAINGLASPKNIFCGGLACIGGELRAGVPVLIEYDGTQFNIIGSGDFFAGTAQGPINLSLAFSVGSSALTVAIKGRNGIDPSATNTVFIPFRNVTEATGDYTWLPVTAANSIVINSTATLGATNGNVPFRIWVVAFNDGGTLRLAVINCLALTTAASGANRDITNIYRLAGWGIASATQEDNSSDSSLVFYSHGAAVTSKAYTVLGYATWETGLTTAGTWDAAPTRSQLFAPGVPLPGQVIQMVESETGAVATGTTAVPVDNTIPQISEGDAYINPPDITCTSAANCIRLSGQFTGANSNSGMSIAASIHKTGVNNALVTSVQSQPTANFLVVDPLGITVLAEVTSAQDFQLRAGAPTGATTTFNGSAGGQLYGGVLNSFLRIEEIMG